jgi:hypothetical protein
MHDLEPPIEMLDDCAAALDPIAAIDIADAEIVMDDGVMDVPADHAIGATVARLLCQRPLELADVVHGVLDLQLGPLRQRPVGKAQPPAQRIEDAIDGDGNVIGLAAEQREPARLRHHEIEVVAMNHEIAPPVAGRVNGMLDDLDATEVHAVIVAQELVVIAGDIDDARPLARLAQELLHHVVVRLRPVPARAELPPVDDVADEIDRVGIVVAEKVEQPVGLTALCAEMHVGNEQRAKRPYAPRGHSAAILICESPRGERLTGLCCAAMTPSTARVT